MSQATLARTTAVADLQAQAAAAGIEVREDFDYVTLRLPARLQQSFELKLAPRLQVQLDKAAQIGSIWVAPDEWLLLLEAGTASSLIAAHSGADSSARNVVLVDVSGTYTCLQLKLANWRELLAQLCYYDFSSANFPPGKAISTNLDQTSAIIAHQTQTSDQPLVLVRNSYAHYVLNMMLNLADAN